PARHRGLRAGAPAVAPGRTGHRAGSAPASCHRPTPALLQRAHGRPGISNPAPFSRLGNSPQKTSRGGESSARAAGYGTRVLHLMDSHPSLGAGRASGVWPANFACTIGGICAVLSLFQSRTTQPAPAVVTGPAEREQPHSPPHTHLETMS